MNKLLVALLVVGLVAGVLGCTLPMTEAPVTETEAVQDDGDDIETTEDSGESSVVADEPLSEDFLQAMDDWVLGTDFGITGVRFENNTFIVSVPDATREGYEAYQIQDIVDGLMGLADYGGYDVDAIVWENGETLESPVVTTDETDNNQQDEAAMEEEDDMTLTTTDTVNLIFIHHSVGENWLNAGLSQMLNDVGIHVADTYYGWAEMGDHTDTGDWPNWFNDAVMPSVYAELNTSTAHNTIQPGSGENAIIMFKSCYPNSDVGNSIEDEKEIYLSLLDYFASHPDKMFVLVTPPPMMRISNPAKTRELTNWLVAADGYRAGYAGDNLFVYDLYNVFTASDNHHWLVDGQEQHEINDATNTLYYDSDGDNHPNDVGNVKAAEEFVPLLLHWYAGFVGE